MISEDTISPLNTTSNHASKPSTSRPRRGTISLPKIEIFEPSNTFEKAEELDIQKRPGRLEAIKAIKTIEKNETASLFKMEADIIAKNYSKLDKLPVATSIIEEFKVFRQELKHPAVIMNVLTESDDDQVVTEFDSLCNELLECLGELEHSLLEFTEWKNEFLDQSAPGALKLQITLLFCKLFRR